MSVNDLQARQIAVNFNCMPVNRKYFHFNCLKMQELKEHGDCITLPLSFYP